jgi:hypothetical protein
MRSRGSANAEGQAPEEGQAPAIGIQEGHEFLLVPQILGNAPALLRRFNRHCRSRLQHLRFDVFCILQVIP